MAQREEATFRRLMGKTEGHRAEWEYPFGAAGVNLAFMLSGEKWAAPRGLPCGCWGIGQWTGLALTNGPGAWMGVKAAGHHAVCSIAIAEVLDLRRPAHVPATAAGRAFLPLLAETDTGAASGGGPALPLYPWPGL